MKLSIDEQLARIRAHTVEIIPEEELVKKLRSGRPLRVKYGVDPTGPDLHLGHAVPLRKLRVLQDLGHLAVLIVGDFTGLIGDPSGRNEGRPQLTRAQVERNMANYREQAFRILDPAKTEFHYNSEWLGKIGYEQIVQLCATHTVAQILAREDFSRRYQAQQPIGLHELLYPLIQGYDSVAINADIEIGATEQKFNMLAGRELQQIGLWGTAQEPQVIITIPILVGTDGVRRMGKSLGNYIGVTEPADEMFGKIMSIPDSVMGDFFTLCTDLSNDEITAMLAEMRAGELNPRDAKRRLAKEIVTLYHGAEAAARADETFLRVFSGSREQTLEDYAALASEVAIPEDLRGRPLWASTAIHQLGLTKTKSEAARLVKAGAVHVDDRQLSDPQEEIAFAAGMLLRVGKRRVVRLV